MGTGEGLVEAAGGVVWRRTPTGSLEVLVVHRPRYGDRSLPKGKLERDERARDAAVREVREETGLDCVLGDKVAEVRYDLPDGRPKRVRWWAMTAPAGADPVPDGDEVDEVAWVLVDDRLEAALSYAEDAAVVRAFEATLGGSGSGSDT